MQTMLFMLLMMLTIQANAQQKRVELLELTSFEKCVVASHYFSPPKAYILKLTEKQNKLSSLRKERAGVQLARFSPRERGEFETTQTFNTEILEAKSRFEQGRAERMSVLDREIANVEQEVRTIEESPSMTDLAKSLSVDRVLISEMATAARYDADAQTLRSVEISHLPWIGDSDGTRIGFTIAPVTSIGGFDVECDIPTGKKIRDTSDAERLVAILRFENAIVSIEVKNRLVKAKKVESYTQNVGAFAVNVLGTLVEQVITGEAKQLRDDMPYHSGKEQIRETCFLISSQRCVLVGLAEMGGGMLWRAD
jgi:hypothetical protein